MTVRLAQAPLPWLPGDAVRVAPGIGVVLEDDRSCRAGPLAARRRNVAVEPGATSPWRGGA